MATREGPFSSQLYHVSICLSVYLSVCVSYFWQVHFEFRGRNPTHKNPDITILALGINAKSYLIQFKPALKPEG
jgi:hypothetical protein